jgi:hypothetical protein
MKIDKQIRQDVLDELRWDPTVNAADVGVTDLLDRLVVRYQSGIPICCR